MNTQIRMSRVIPASIVFTLLFSTSIAAYRYETSIGCIDDLSELSEIARERAKHNNNAPLHVNNVLYNPDKMQWCFRYEVD